MKKPKKSIRRSKLVLKSLIKSLALGIPFAAVQVGCCVISFPGGGSSAPFPATQIECSRSDGKWTSEPC